MSKVIRGNAPAVRLNGHKPRIRTPEPLGERVLLRRGDAKKQTDGGLVLPDVADTKAERGVVAFAGDECKRLKVGDVVQMPAILQLVDCDGEKLEMCREQEIAIRWR